MYKSVLNKSFCPYKGLITNQTNVQNFTSMTYKRLLHIISFQYVVFIWNCKNHKVTYKLLLLENRYMNQDSSISVELPDQQVLKSLPQRTVIHTLDGSLFPYTATVKFLLLRNQNHWLALFKDFIKIFIKLFFFSVFVLFSRFPLINGIRFFLSSK